MHFFRFGAGVALVMAAALGSGACSSDAGGPTPSSTTPAAESASSHGTVVGRLSVHVDPNAADPVTITELPLADASGPGTKPLTTGTLPASNSVMSSVSLSGPGTWDATNKVMSATVVLTNNSTGDMDEPQMVVTSLTSSSTNVAFTTNNNGATQSGAVIAFADIQGSSSTNKCGSGSFRGVKKTALHYLRISDPDAVSFTFTVDVRAVTTGTLSIFPDCDQDAFNAEAQDAGNDCNDFSPAPAPTPPAVGSPGTCSCATCTTSGATCNETGSYTCANSSVCQCDITASNQSDVAIVCKHDCTSTCTQTSDGADAGTVSCNQDCSNNSTCSHTCSQGTSGSCTQACSGASSCDLACTNNTSGNGCSQDCAGISACALTCTGNTKPCDETCRGGSDCTVACGDAGGTCNMDCSGNSTTCNMACTNGTTCTEVCSDNKTDACDMTCDATSSCTLDCSAVAANRRATRCVLDCGTRTKVESPANSGIFTCQ